MSKYTPKVYTILISKDLKNQNWDSTHHRPPTTKIVKSLRALDEILIKYKNQTDP